MASFFKSLLIFTILVIYSEDCVCKPSGVPEGRGALMLLERICGTDTTHSIKSKILLCFICNGLVPSCLSSSTTTTTPTERPSISGSPASSTVNVPNAPTTQGE